MQMRMVPNCLRALRKLIETPSVIACMNASLTRPRMFEMARVRQRGRTRVRATLVWLGLTVAFALGGVPLAGATPTDDSAQTIVHLLDYLGSDYPHAVQDGRAIDVSEYREQSEFAAQVGVLLKQLPTSPMSASLATEAEALAAMVTAKQEGVVVSAQATRLRNHVIDAYQLAVAPKTAPDLARGATLFAGQCAACHGTDGHGDGPAAAGLQPKPTDFHDVARMQSKSTYALYNTITLGVDGTAMRAFKELPDDDRWALAFFVATRDATPSALAHGEAAWKRGIGKGTFGSLKALVTLAPADARTQRGDELADVQTYLRAHPAALQVDALAPLAITRAKLDAVVASYTRGQMAQARQSAIDAYLDGFEMIEASLDNVDHPLRTDVERAMMDLRTTIASGASTAAVTQQVTTIRGLLDRVDAALSGGAISPATLFFSSLLILLREGLEAILVLAAIIAFVLKTGRRDAMPYIHLGWIAALVLGAATWFLTTRLIDLSGASREVTEGVTALIAAGMLLYVGYWLHSKAYANAWQTFIRNQVGAALEKGTLWTMAGVAFLAVYREIVEVVLFYEALWAQAPAGGHAPVIGGLVAAVVALGVIGWALLKYSVRLPLGPFFVGTSVLLALLAVVFVGNGVHALQEAGMLGARSVAFVSLPLLGVYPTEQGLSAQLAALVAVVAAFVWARRDKTAAD